jgi:uncharacterized UPF0146 family protein
MVSMKFFPQVDKSHYEEKYDDLDRFISYLNQIEIIRRINEKEILEIGIGNKTVTNYLKQRGFSVETCDFDKDLGPDYVGDIRNLPLKDEKYDLISAFEILEHIPWRDLDKAFLELNRVSKKYVVISVPYSSAFFSINIRTNFFYKLWKGKISINLRMPLFFSKKRFDGQHYWVLGRKGNSLKSFREKIKKNFKIVYERKPGLNPFHYYFVLKKRF